ncbi:hypothetical protein POM88_051127 [Heracleum sosnowskyi]|uniref:PB1 domain-containing protein n=1 Tax=Heracleum sosnowskyi TaxID=360622 RepID=A0AAD8M247_9APIA|nr:hypothetical protein POM88_051127 [Heracleum sosnowskyi]
MSTDKASSTNVIILSDRAVLNIIFAISVLILEVCTPTSPLFYAVLIRLYTLFWYLLAASLLVDEVAVPIEFMSESEKPEAAAATTEEFVHASDESKDAFPEFEYDEFQEFNDQQYLDNRFVQRFLFKITYGCTVKRFVAPIVNESFVFNMSGLKEKITSLFNLPIDSELELLYIDEHWELITMTDDNDLEDIMTQMTLPVLRMYVKVIDNAPPVQVGEGAGLGHTCSSKSTSSSECDLPAKSDNDDWLLF